MQEYELPTLKIDKEFKTLIRPLSRKEYLQLEENILEDGCRDPIMIWNGFIVDGHNRYEICRKHQIPFKTQELTLETKEEVLAWICKNQLGRRNISEETRKYLIGRQYESEKIANKLKNPTGRNQYSEEETYRPDEPLRPDSITSTAIRIADENNITSATVRKYAIYAKALEEIRVKNPEIASMIISGKYKVSHDNVIALAKHSAAELRKIQQTLEQTQKSFVQYSRTRKVINGPPFPTPQLSVSVKNMPKYDPDAPLIELSLTIPSWVSSIERAINKYEPEETTDNARNRLVTTLTTLSTRIQELLALIKKE